MTALLKPLELLWRAVNQARRALYRHGILKAKRLPKPVISVGSISAGGAGKTPATIAIGRYLLDRGYRVAVLTRGYGRAGEGGVVDELDAARFGDEPVVIKRHLNDATVIVGSNRYEKGLTVDCDVYLLDDGFQHLQLARDVDVVIDAPGRWLRERRGALRHGDVVIPRRLEVDVPPGRLFAFAGLADNEQFFKSLPNVVGTRGFPDHHRYTAGDLEEIRRAARDAGADAIVTTEKDAVKIRDDGILAVTTRFVIEPSVLESIEARIRR